MALTFFTISAGPERISLNMSTDQAPGRPLPAALENIECIARLENHFLENRTLVDRIGDGVGGFVGTMWFVLIHVAWFVFWFVVNLSLIPGIRPFDPFPFILLSVAVSMEGVLLTTFVLMKQNRMSKRADHRNQLNLQIDMLSERELTKILQMLTVISSKLGLEETASEPEVAQLSQTTAVDVLAHEIKKRVPD